MMSSFDLVAQPWIPCVTLEGHHLQVGLGDAVRRAHELREVSDPSPLVTVALHRLLLAILHRVFGPATIDEWSALWRAGRLPEEPTRRYLDEWRGRFDLFHHERPFYQTPGLEEDYAVPASKLLHELASGHNDTLFDHTHEMSATCLTAAHAARGLVAHQAYSVGGTITFRARHGESADPFKFARHGPLLKGAATLLRGPTLCQTLLLNLHRYSVSDEVPFHATMNDLPAWERDGPIHVGDRAPEGYLDLLTWQSRRILLYPSDGDRAPVVCRVAIMKGSQFPDGFTLQGREMMLSFAPRLRPADAAEPWQPLSFSEDRAIWRDSLALLQSAEASSQPKVLSWARELLGVGALDRGRPLLIDLFGISVDPKRVASVLLWRHERLSLPAAYLEDALLRTKLNEALRLSEDVAELLSRAAERIARFVLAPGSGRPDSRKLQAEDVNRLRDHLALQRSYWSRLDRPFRRLLFELESDRMEDADGLKYGLRALPWWAAQVRAVARESFLGGTVGLENSRSGMKAMALAETLFCRQLRGVTAAHVEEEVWA
jgi:CRISPR system Cascade subunit CasA